MKLGRTNILFHFEWYFILTQLNYLKITSKSQVPNNLKRDAADQLVGFAHISMENWSNRNLQTDWTVGDMVEDMVAW